MKNAIKRVLILLCIVMTLVGCKNSKNTSAEFELIVFTNGEEKTYRAHSYIDFNGRLTLLDENRKVIASMSTSNIIYEIKEGEEE